MEFQKELKSESLKGMLSIALTGTFTLRGIGFKAFSPQNSRQRINYHADFSDSNL